MYRSLDSTAIITTLERLQRRVAERFPEAGLNKVCAELTEIARENDGRARMLARPRYELRALSWLVIASGLALIAFVATNLEVKQETETVASLLQGIDAGFNILLLMGAAVVFLISLEARWKRQQALVDLDELRSIIHVIDMHQLTKDPAGASNQLSPTASSPARLLTPAEVIRYLDYCSEMLSLAAKVAAVYAQSSKDPQVVEASSDLQQITANLSAKIWQKINIAQSGLNLTIARAEAAARPVPPADIAGNSAAPPAPGGA